MGGEQDKDAIDVADVGQRLGRSIGHISVDLILVDRALGLLDGITKQLDPNLNALEIVAGYASKTSATSSLNQ